MARVEYSLHALDDLDRLTNFLLESKPEYAPATTDLIVEGIRALENHPLIGRPAEDELRELVISRGRSGYIALYSLEECDTVAMILSIRHQREVGYA